MTILILSALLAAGPVEIWTASDLKASANALSGTHGGMAGIEGKTLGAASVWRRVKSGEAELHKMKTDLLLIEEGSATLIYGGAIRGAHTTQINEIRGASIDGGQSKKLVPGDIVRIAPNTPHQFVLEKGQSITYFALKLAR